MQHMVRVNAFSTLPDKYSYRNFKLRSSYQANPYSIRSFLSPQFQPWELQGGPGAGQQALQHPRGAGARVPGLPAPRRALRDDLPLLLHEGGGQPRLLRHPRLGQESDPQPEDQQLQGELKDMWGTVYTKMVDGEIISVLALAISRTN